MRDVLSNSRTLAKRGARKAGALRLLDGDTDLGIRGQRQGTS